MPIEDRDRAAGLQPPLQTAIPTTTSLGRQQWLVLAAAMLGWMFDGLEMGLFPIAGRPALQDLLAITDDAVIGEWNSFLVALFLGGAACGGLLFGWLGDRMGRVRTMALSILAYSFFTGCCYFATAPWQLGVLRFFAALGMGGEWALGVALVMECWPERLRPILAGVIGAAGNVGYLIISILAMFVEVTPQSWRWTMLACSSPALLAFFVLVFIPESKRWQESVKMSASNPIREIFTTRLLKPTLLAILFASIPLIGTWGAVSGFLPFWVGQLVGPENPHAKAVVQFWASVGAIVGCMVGSLLGGKIGRRPAYFTLCLASLLVCAFLFRGLDEYNNLFLVTSALVGCVTASFYGWLPLYLPELFPTRVRATGQGLCFNFGRVIAMIGVLGTGQLMHYFEGSYARACATITLVYVFGMVFIWLAPETKGKPLPE
ncbi:MAG: MFS transporter [Planctomycetia bacterium]|nr:MFS transporter [Planctomycetia bacterium]